MHRKYLRKNNEVRTFHCDNKKNKTVSVIIERINDRERARITNHIRSPRHEWLESIKLITDDKSIKRKTPL